MRGIHRNDGVKNRDPALLVSGGNAAPCPESGKHKYVTRAAARIGRRIVKQKYGAKVNVYQCWHCKLFHLTSSKGKR